MFRANERCYNRTFGLYGLETLNHRSELKILWNTFRSQNFGFHMIAGSQTIADDRRRSQTIAEDHDRRIAGDRRSVFPYDRRRSQNFLRSAICDPRSSAIIWKPALTEETLVTVTCVVYPFILYDQCKYVRVCYVTCCYFLAALFAIVCLGSQWNPWDQLKKTCYA